MRSGGASRCWIAARVDDRQQRVFESLIDIGRVRFAGAESLGPFARCRNVLFSGGPAAGLDRFTGKAKLCLPIERVAVGGTFVRQDLEF